MSINGTHEERTFIYYPDEQEKNLKNDFQGPLTKLEWPTDYLIIALIGMELFFESFYSSIAHWYIYDWFLCVIQNLPTCD